MCSRIRFLFQAIACIFIIWSSTIKKIQFIVRPVLSALLLISCLFSTLALADVKQTSTGWVTDPNHPPVSVLAELTGQIDKDKDKQSVNALLQVRLAGEWKTYWRSPGEGGVAPSFDFSNSTNIKEVNWLWPAPKRYPVSGVETIGYKGQVNFPLTIVLQDMGQPARLKGILTLASCTNICVLGDYEIDLTFAPNTLVSLPEVVFKFGLALGTIPILITEQQLLQQQDNATISQVRSSWNPLKQQLVVQMNNRFGWSKPDLFIDSDSPDLAYVTFSVPEVNISNKTMTATIKASSWSGEVDLANKVLHATVLDTNLAVELVTTTSDQIISSKTADGLLPIFLIALLGGLILNILPCVLPVLGMKLSSILSAHGIQRGQIRRQFLASSLGILTSFWLLAVFLLLLKLSGQALGWGIQFQSPYFIAVMVIITALFAANMLGLFEIQLPVAMQTWLAGKGSQSYLGHYLQGMFATLLATPCSAPFLGTAVAFALGGSIVELFVIFTALGLGMSLPWLLIALFPAIALLLPKPGRWMGTVKLVFALMILATTFWLLSLLGNFIGTSNMFLTAALLLVVLFTLTLRKYGKRILLIALISLLLSSALGFLLGSLTTEHWASPIAGELDWSPLDAAAIQQQVASGKTVFVDVTADWCITCKANKIGVILQEPVYTALQAENIQLMQGDWTVRSDSVTAYLQSYGRYGVPFNIVYGPGAPEGLPLPTILSSKQVLSALQQAQK
ncbi:cytochrome c biogenesis protein, transmembrane region [Psychromonas ingrahamii 37]|uniref:Cytochrome c biogenesis protein, transmembrane region n=1 Tax=Psychromonas ingrahamii (strain DSM 17664 / CCUG 51855 / 37) TaxID=357804 RepID=A1T0M5_PSYIN|nr:cytochrome c biogenesis protein, transmembrane region [Psychromonas ingrahamii 37]